MKRLKLLVLSQVLPFPRNSGQQQRVFYKLKALREFFHVTFVTTADQSKILDIRKNLLDYCDEAIIQPSIYSQNLLTKVWYRSIGAVYQLRTSLKFSNYKVGELEFSSNRLREILNLQEFDCALFEYWHAVNSVAVFHQKSIPCILDMHDILWRSFKRQIDVRAGLPKWWKRWAIAQYKMREEAAWAKFDGLIAINRAEYEYARSMVPSNVRMFYAPMGIDISQWPYSWQPAAPPRIAYYGGLGNRFNQRDALLCYRSIMPQIWNHIPNAELWLVGSQPSNVITTLPREEPRVHVTGFVEQVQEILKTMSLVLCPWSGTHGFRSRLVEVMALGVPVVSSSDAIYGMDMQVGQGIFTSETSDEMAKICLNLLKDRLLLDQQSNLAHQQIARKFNYQETYGQLAEDILSATYEIKNHGC